LLYGHIRLHIKNKRSIIFSIPANPGQKMIIEKNVATVYQVLPDKTTTIDSKVTGPLEFIGGKGQFKIHQPGSPPIADVTYYDDQSLTIHDPKGDIIIQLFDENHQVADSQLAPDGNSFVGTATTVVHRLLPGETEQINLPEPMRIIGGVDVFYVRSETPGVLGPDAPYSTPLITHPQGPSGPVVIFDVFSPQEFQESVVLDG
jgi:hypothetical protein